MEDIFDLWIYLSSSSSSSSLSPPPPSLSSSSSPPPPPPPLCLQGRLLKKEREAQEKLNQLRSNLAKIEEAVELKRNTIKDCRGKAAAITKELASIGSGAAALEGVEQELETAVSGRAWLWGTE